MSRIRELDLAEIETVSGGGDIVDEIVVAALVKRQIFFFDHIYSIEPQNWNAIYDGPVGYPAESTQRRPNTVVTVEAVPRERNGQIIWERTYNEYNLV